MRSKSPIFVVGTPRSGTTLTAKIIGSHPDIYMPGEVHFFDDIYSMRSELGAPNSHEGIKSICDKLFTLYGRYNEPQDQLNVENIFRDADGLIDSMRGSKSYCEILDRFMQTQTQHFDKKRWGNNAPRDIFNVEEILHCYPDAKFVVCVRDIRAFLLSYKGKWRNTSEVQVERLKKLYHPVVTSFLWKASMKQLVKLKEMVSDENYIIIKYEDLVRHPESTVRSICTTIDADFDSQMLDIMENNSSHLQSTKGIFSSSVDKWKNELSFLEIRVSQIVAKREISDLDYEKVDAPVNILQLLIVFLSTPYYLIRAILANRHKMGPLFPFLLKRIKSLVSTSKLS